MTEIEGDFEGQVILDPIKYSKILTKTVTKNNDTSGKVLLPADYISETVIVLLPKIKSRKGESDK